MYIDVGDVLIGVAIFGGLFLMVHAFLRGADDGED